MDLLSGDHQHGSVTSVLHVLDDIGSLIGCELGLGTSLLHDLLLFSNEFDLVFRHICSSSTGLVSASFLDL